MRLQRRVRAILALPVLRDGVWTMLAVQGADGLVAWVWRLRGEMVVAVVNLGQHEAHGRVVVDPFVAIEDLLDAGATARWERDALALCIPAGGAAVLRFR